MFDRPLRLAWERPERAALDESLERVLWTPELTTTRTHDGYDVRADELGSFLVEDLGAQVTIRPSGRCTEGELEELFYHSVLPRLHQLRGTPAVHASAVSLRGSCIGLFGPSGTGKSTLAASLAKKGWPLVSDDALVISLAAGGPLAHASKPTSRLRDDSAMHMQVNRNGELVYGKHVANVPIESAEIPLASLYLLDVGETVGSVRLSQRDALLALAEHLHRLDPHDPELLAKEVEFLEAIVRRVPVRRLLYPRSYERIAEVADALVRDFEDDEHGRGNGSART